MITLRLDKLTDPLAKAYLTVPDFLDYLKAFMQYEIIHQRSLPRNAVGRAWRKSYDATPTHRWRQPDSGHHLRVGGAG
eukprot:213333-Rhodomonas_salina.1